MVNLEEKAYSGGTFTGLRETLGIAERRLSAYTRME